MSRAVTTVVAAAGAALIGGVGLAQPAQASEPSCAGLSPVSTLDSVTYLDRLVRAWGAGNTQQTACYADATLRNALWSLSDTGGSHWVRTSDEGAAGTVYATYHDTARGGTITVSVTNVLPRSGGGWHAARYYSVSNTANEHASRADAAIRSWGRGDRVATGYFATATVTNTLFAYRNPGGSYWHAISGEGAAGHSYTTYRYGTTSAKLTLGVANPGITGTWAHDVDQVYIGR
ncbi:hypothetical protein PZ938_17170 [Luteipulveratus sp. YIM 133132]|uniref:hypothetical protein n=1 Tax=Luteipulveratus flavus TaxID=3031728 RepID=UPI0023B0BC6D|nr:hypothetical protein [Luteipulveratus sp. YIM 133132]MDE9367353.1 hypothetical protein [Luteipulveratus sp. YIM 133132]